ncbi:MAG: TetR/AcrR family transcriptional regulator [Planctomycetaceae bacterium]|nr:TetR/AcrR family transcriptional regulator [Planctomycetaceae bacterium]
MTAPKNLKRKQRPKTDASRSSEMRDHVLDCALTIFAEKGYAATSVRDIIHAAGVTQPTLYYYFEGKLGLFLELLSVKYEASLRELQSSISEVQGCREQLHSIMLQSFSYCSADVRVPRLMFQTAYGPDIPGVTEQLERLGNERFDLVKSVIAQGIAAGELPQSSVDGLALAFCCLMDQHINVLSRLNDSPSKLTPQLADWLVDLFFQGALSA